MPEAPDINRQVIRAVRDLGGRQVQWPTAAEVAKHLKHDESLVLASLRDLKAKRIFKDRQRQGRRVWMPWNQP